MKADKTYSRAEPITLVQAKRLALAAIEARQPFALTFKDDAIYLHAPTASREAAEALLEDAT